MSEPRDTVAAATPHWREARKAKLEALRSRGIEPYPYAFDVTHRAQQVLDLGEAVTTADRVLSGDARPGEILLLSDVQATALGPAKPAAPLAIGRPQGDAPRNAGLASVSYTHLRAHET